MSSKPRLFTTPFLRLWAFNGITFFAAFQLFPTIPFRIIDLGGSEADAGLFLAIYTYACAFSAPITGTLSDHFGRQRSLLVASSAFVVFSLLYGVIPSLSLLLPVALIHGVLWSALLSASGGILATIVPESRRTEGLAYWGMASTLAVSISPLIGLVVYRRFGWLALCAELAAISVVMIFMALRVEAEAPVSKPFPRVRHFFDVRVMIAAFTLAVVSFGYGGITSYVARLSIARKIEPDSLFFTVFAVTVIVTRVLTSQLGDRLGAKALLLPCLFLVPFSHLLLAYVETKTALVVAAIIFGTGFGGAYPAFVTFVLGKTAAENRAAVFGSILWAFDIGIGSGSWVTGYLVEHRGYSSAFLVCAILSAASIPIFFATSRVLDRPGRAAVPLAPRERGLG